MSFSNCNILESTEESYKQLWLKKKIITLRKGMQLLHFLQIYSYNAAFYKTMPFQKIQKAL